MAPARLFAGSRTIAGYVDDFGEDARFNFPACFTRDENYLYVTEWVGERVRRVSFATAEVTTAATLTGAGPFGIIRHSSGRFYVTCATERSVRIYDAGWSLLDTILLVGHRPWFACPSDDESQVFVTGHVDDVSETFDSRFYRYDASGTQLASISTTTVAGGSFRNTGGVVQIGSTVYWMVARNDGRGLYTSGLAPTVAGDFTFVLDMDSLAAGYWSGRQLHRNDAGDELQVAFGPAQVNSGAGTNAYGDGARRIALPGYTITDPAIDEHAGGTGHSTAASDGSIGNYESDYLVFGRHFVISSKVAQTVGNAAFEAMAGPHCIEILGPGALPHVHVVD